MSATSGRGTGRGLDGVPPVPGVRVVSRDRLGTGLSSGGMAREEAISKRLVGSEGIFMGISRVSPGLSSSAHVHTNCESALFVVAGRGYIRGGSRLETRLDVSEGDFIYVPPGAPHSVTNDGESELVLVVARNTQEEHVTEYVEDERT